MAGGGPGGPVTDSVANPDGLPRPSTALAVTVLLPVSSITQANQWPDE